MYGLAAMLRFFLTFLVAAGALPVSAQVQFCNPLGICSSGTLLEVICNVRNGLFPFLLAFAVIAFIAAGLLYFLGGGDEQKLSAAKKALWAGIIGTLLAFLSFGLPSIIAELFGVDASSLPMSCT